MEISDIDFELPSGLIASEPLAERSASKLLRISRDPASYDDNSFNEVVNFLRPDDVLVVNNTKVFPARLIGRTETGARVEVFLVMETGDREWQALAKPGRRLSIGKQIIFGPDLTSKVIEKLDNGRIRVRFESAIDLESAIDRYGRTPLPPYINRDAGESDTDRERYQTVFAAKRGAIAAPTAGLHFTDAILESIRAKGVRIVEITLHVGYGTFEPVRVSDIADHRVEPERIEISKDAADIINEALNANRRLVAVGTTTTRALESVYAKHHKIVAGEAWADLTIIPGFQFNVVGALITNFHLPRSSLLVLVSTFAGRELIMRAYQHAIKERYRFYSYGDCMLIE